MNGTSELLHSLSMGCVAHLRPYKATPLTRQHIFSTFLTERKKKKSYFLFEILGSSARINSLILFEQMWFYILSVCFELRYKPPQPLTWKNACGSNTVNSKKTNTVYSFDWIKSILFKAFTKFSTRNNNSLQHRSSTSRAFWNRCPVIIIIWLRYKDCLKNQEIGFLFGKMKTGCREGMLGHWVLQEQLLQTAGCSHEVHSAEQRVSV